MKAQEALESLAPGGSEFIDDPERCLEFAKHHLDNQISISKRLVRQRNEVTRKLYHLLDLSASASEMLELAAVAVGRLKCDDCPKRTDDCPAFWKEDANRNTWPCHTVPIQLRELAQALREMEEENDG